MPRTFRVIILPRAFKDLDQITLHIKADSPTNAIKTFERLYDAAKTLSVFPHRYKVQQARRDPALTVHSMPVLPFIIYYRIDETAGTVRVLTIRHGKRRQPKRFP